MLLFYKAMLALAILLLISMQVRLNAARKVGRRQEWWMLRWFVLGLSLTACSYVYRIHDISLGAHPSYGGFLFCVAGTAALSVAYREWVKVRFGRGETRPRPAGEWPGERFFPESGRAGRVAFRFSACAYQALLRAQGEARGCGLDRVDTDHLLLGLLGQRQGGGVHLLRRLGISPVSLRMALRTETAHGARRERAPAAEDEPRAVLTDRACQVVDFAAQEARRFDSACIGTEHLLIGLVLKGTGPAAHALFGQGVTADRVRQELLQDRPSGAGEVP